MRGAHPAPTSPSGDRGGVRRGRGRPSTPRLGAPWDVLFLPYLLYNPFVHNLYDSWFSVVFQAAGWLLLQRGCVLPLVLLKAHPPAPPPAGSPSPWSTRPPIGPDEPATPTVARPWSTCLPIGWGGGDPPWTGPPGCPPLLSPLLLIPRAVGALARWALCPEGAPTSD